jgi:hypothetical protein
MAVSGNLASNGSSNSGADPRLIRAIPSNPDGETEGRQHAQASSGPRTPPGDPSGERELEAGERGAAQGHVAAKRAHFEPRNSSEPGDPAAKGRRGFPEIDPLEDVPQGPLGREEAYLQGAGSFGDAVKRMHRLNPNPPPLPPHPRPSPRTSSPAQARLEQLRRRQSQSPEPRIAWMSTDSSTTSFPTHDALGRPFVTYGPTGTSESGRSASNPVNTSGTLPSVFSNLNLDSETEQSESGAQGLPIPLGARRKFCPDCKNLPSAKACKLCGRKSALRNPLLLPIPEGSQASEQWNGVERTRTFSPPPTGTRSTRVNVTPDPDGSPAGQRRQTSYCEDCWKHPEWTFCGKCNASDLSAHGEPEGSFSGLPGQRRRQLQENVEAPQPRRGSDARREAEEAHQHQRRGPRQQAFPVPSGRRGEIEEDISCMVCQDVPQWYGCKGCNVFAPRPEELFPDDADARREYYEFLLEQIEEEEVRLRDEKRLELASQKARLSRAGRSNAREGVPKPACANVGMVKTFLPMAATPVLGCPAENALATQTS